MILSYEKCEMCAHRCGVNREAAETGICRMTDKCVIARAALHMWEEPIISGTRGSGAIFFSGCSLGCVFCQNRDISRTGKGKTVSAKRLSDIMFELESLGAHNINLVTPTHFAKTVREALEIAKRSGLAIPIVYNTSSYDTPETLKCLDGLIDIYLPDFKYCLSKTAVAFSFAADYPESAKLAIAEMVRQRPNAVIENGLMKSGVVVRILLLPSHVAEAKLSLKYLYSEYGDSVYFSLMNQYTPMNEMKPPLNRRVTHAEYLELIEYADKLGIKNGFTQEFGSAEESFIPSFDNTGV